MRKPLRVRDRTSRTLGQRLGVRFPYLAAASFPLATQLPLRSRARQILVWRLVRDALEAYNRRDLDAAALGFHKDLEYYPYREFVEAGPAE